MSTTPIVDTATLRTYVEKLTKAIGSGVRSVTLGGQTITYNTSASLIEARDNMVKQIQKQVENLEEKLKAALSSEGKDKNVRFDELGVDFLMVDEAHEYRKLEFGTSRQVKGISPDGSQKAFDLFMKSRYLEEKTPGRSLVMASGTVITNTLAELYTVQKFMDRLLLRVPVAMACQAVPLTPAVRLDELISFTPSGGWR